MFTKTNRKTILILGSKPNSPLPKLEPDIVVTANGAASLAAHYERNSSPELITVIAAGQLKDKKVVQNVLDANPDKIVFRKSAPPSMHGFFSKHTDASIEEYSEREQYELQKQHLGLLIYFDLFAPLALTKKVSRVLRWGFGHYTPFGVSTGIWAIIYALHNWGVDDRLVVAGVGLQSGGHFYGSGTFQEVTARKDRVLAPHLQINRQSIYTTDRTLAAATGAQLWHAPPSY